MEFSKKKRFWLVTALLCLILVLILGFFVYWRASSNHKIVGVQIITSKGAVLIGRDKHTHKTAVWYSPLTGYFDSNGLGHFFEIKSQKEEKNSNNWSIKWQWDELYEIGKNEALIDLSFPDKETSIETLEEMCRKDTEEGLSCQWNEKSSLEIQGLGGDFLCVSEISEQFYGGAHPLERKSFGNLSLSTQKAKTFKEVIPSQEDRDMIFLRLRDQIVRDWSQFLLPGQDSSDKDLEQLLNDMGYKLDANAFCPMIRPEGIFLVFGFSHLDQNNRGLNFKMGVALDKEEIQHSSLKNLAKRYLFDLDKQGISTEVHPSDGSWAVSQNINEISVHSQTYNVLISLILPPTEESLNDDLLGIYWIHSSPNQAGLKKYHFKKIDPKKYKAKKLDLNKVLSK